MDEANRALTEIREALPDASLCMIRDVRTARDPQVIEREIAALRNAGIIFDDLRLGQARLHEIGCLGTLD
jgi:hypothetical protein